MIYFRLKKIKVWIEFGLDLNVYGSFQRSLHEKPNI